MLRFPLVPRPCSSHNTYFADAYCTQSSLGALGLVECLGEVEGLPEAEPLPFASSESPFLVCAPDAYFEGAEKTSSNGPSPPQIRVGVQGSGTRFPLRRRLCLDTEADKRWSSAAMRVRLSTHMTTPVQIDISPPTAEHHTYMSITVQKLIKEERRGNPLSDRRPCSEAGQLIPKVMQGMHLLNATFQPDKTARLTVLDGGVPANASEFCHSRLSTSG